MKQEMIKELNNQITHELYNSFVYLSISNFYFLQKMYGLGKYYKKQSDEERCHAQKIIDFLLQFELDQNIDLSLISPTQDWNNLYMPLDVSLSLEITTTKQIWDLMDKAMQLEDYETQDFLQWFIDEQVQEEHQANYIITQAKLDGTYNGLALRLLDDNLKDK